MLSVFKFSSEIKNIFRFVHFNLQYVFDLCDALFVSKEQRAMLPGGRKGNNGTPEED